MRQAIRVSMRAANSQTDICVRETVRMQSARPNIRTIRPSATTRETHVNERSVKCKLCGRELKHRKDLKRHEFCKWT
ncbi:unnamed protein product [Onchocerca flexuosa]|uniref:C2H2-type domain-containing protein n=1 Tax=Onchocerca flexuosa TaxID=387005 RepID=A0A183I5Q5_9BILA|nr:unnamed protein product [Onchocerca flexuosa]